MGPSLGVRVNRFVPLLNPHGRGDEVPSRPDVVAMGSAIDTSAAEAARPQSILSQRWKRCAILAHKYLKALSNLKRASPLESTAMSFSSVSVITNALRLRKVEL